MVRDLTQKALRLTVTMSSFVNYFAPLAQDERTPIAREPVKNGIRNRRSIARVVRRRAIEHQRTEDAQVEQCKSLTRNKVALKLLPNPTTSHEPYYTDTSIRTS
jgi:hypothetical protein